MYINNILQTTTKAIYGDNLVTMYIIYGTAVLQLRNASYTYYIYETQRR
jgi:hypothetical protein